MAAANIPPEGLAWLEMAVDDRERGIDVNGRVVKFDWGELKVTDRGLDAPLLVTFVPSFPLNKVEIEVKLYPEPLPSEPCDHTASTLVADSFEGRDDGALVAHVSCGNCGTSGSVLITPDDVLWPEDEDGEEPPEPVIMPPEGAWVMVHGERVTDPHVVLECLHAVMELGLVGQHDSVTVISGTAEAGYPVELPGGPSGGRAWVPRRWFYEWRRRVKEATP